MQEVKKNPYQVLGVGKKASTKEVKRAWRKLAQRYHPDRNPGDDAAEQKYKEISSAYEVLGDAKKRKLYDEFGDVSLQSGFDADQARRFGGFGGGQAGFGGGFEDIFSKFFGGGGGRGPIPTRGHDTSTTLRIDFLTSIRGGKRTLRVGHETLEVDIPEGVHSGQKIRLANLGGMGSQGGPRGDLFITIEVEPHQRFRREGQDIHTDVPVTLLELVEGATISVQAPDGIIEFPIPAHSHNGQKVRLKGLGVPNRKGGRGNLYLHLKLKLPDTKDPRLLTLAREIEALYKEPVREQ